MKYRSFDDFIIVFEQGVEVDKEFREIKQSLEETKEVNVIHGVVLSDYVIKVKPKKGEQSTESFMYTFCVTPQQFVAPRRKNSSRSFII